MPSADFIKETDLQDVLDGVIVGVGVFVGVLVTVGVTVDVLVTEGVTVAVLVGVGVFVGVFVCVGVIDGVVVGVLVGFGVFVGVNGNTPNPPVGADIILGFGIVYPITLALDSNNTYPFVLGCSTIVIIPPPG